MNREREGEDSRLKHALFEENFYYHSGNDETKNEHFIKYIYRHTTIYLPESTLKCRIEKRMSRLLVLMILLTVMHGILSCPCDEPTPQRSACKNDFVVQAKVTGETKREKNIKYRLQVEAVYKKNRAFDRMIRGGRTMYVETLEDAPCRVNLTKQEIYAVTGRVVDNKADVTACDFVLPWSQLSGEQLAGLQQWYYNACD